MRKDTKNFIKSAEYDLKTGVAEEYFSKTILLTPIILAPLIKNK
jgi:hypothetical protein